MDLSRIEQWTRKTLEEEARGRGIRDPHLRGRGELVRLILRHQYGPRINRGRKRVSEGLEALSQARELIEAAVDAAAGALPKPLGEMVQLSLPFRRTSPGTITSPGTTKAPQPEPEPLPEPEPEARPRVASRTLTEPSAARIHHFEQEPIRTHSMARLLARQGHRERALAIYEELLARGDDDNSLPREAELLRAGGDVGKIPSVLPRPRADHPLPPSTDRITCEGSGDGGVGISWAVTPEGAARARAVLGEPGELAVRLVAISPDETLVVRSHVTEYGPVTDAGSWETGPLDTGARRFVAIGLRTDKRFVAIAHTRA